MLHLILGKSGSGKTRRALNILSELRKKGDTRLLMLVPDQSSFETETAFLEILGPKLSRDVLVFGFSRLCEFVFKKTGSQPKNVIDDGVRRILMSKAINEVQDNLTMFSSTKTRRSVLDLMLHSLKECRKDNISTEMLSAASDKIENATLKQKLTETSLVLDAYSALLSQSLVDPLENLTRLRDVLTDNNIFEGYTIVADSFSGFTYQQLEVLSVLMRGAGEFYATLNLDFERREEELFATTNRTRKALRLIAKRNGVKIAPDEFLETFKRSEKADISFLENNIFRPDDNSYPEFAENIETYVASNTYREAEYVARKIKQLVFEDGYKYNDIAVVSRNSFNYNGILDTAFEKYNIPYFMDVPEDIFTKPVVRFVCSALDCVLNGFNREMLLSMLKTGLAPFSETEISDFENYLFVWNIDRAALKKPFSDNPSGFDKLTPADEKLLMELEDFRKRVVEPLEKLKDICAEASALDITKAIYSLMNSYELEKQVGLLCSKLEKAGLTAQADEEVRVYNLLIEALDKLTAAVTEPNISLASYRDYLEYMLTDVVYGEIPRYQDQVSVGIADRVRLNSASVVFLIGAVDGEFPGVPKTAGAFSELERRELTENEIPLTDSLEELAAHEKYLIYCALTSASDRIYVSTYRGDYSGKSYEPSVIFTELERMFPKRRALTEGMDDEAYCLYNKAQAFDYLARHFDDNTPETESMKELFSQDIEYSGRLEKLEYYLDRAPVGRIRPQTAEKLFGKNLNISASQLEKYNLCAFQYFCNYGLRARERRRASIDDIQFGNIVHFYLEKFLKRNKKAVLSQLTDDEITKNVNEIMQQYADEALGGLDGKSASFLANFERLKINIFSLTKHLILQLSFTDFIPVDFELKIGKGAIPPYKVELGDERSVSLNGFVDRVDALNKNEEETYIRIIDYKTGHKTFTLTEILYGINLQMLIYLRAITRDGEDYYGKKLIPSGILYMPSSFPIINSDDVGAKSTPSDEARKALRMNGLLLNDPDVVNSMDRSSQFIKLSKKQLEGEYSDAVASGEQFALIFNHIDSTIRSMGQSLLDGNVSVKPLKGLADGCAYCPYDSVCLRDYDDDYRYSAALNAKEIYEKLREGAENNEQG